MEASRQDLFKFKMRGKIFSLNPSGRADGVFRKETLLSHGIGDSGTIII